MKILVFPKDLNPYQELLYGQMRDRYKSSRIKYLAGPTTSQTINLFFLPGLIIIYRLRGYKIFHIHWFYFFAIPKLNFGIFKLIMKYYCIFNLRLIKILGYKLVWTVHETISHTAITKNDISTSRYISQLTSNIAEAKIVHSEIVINEMQVNSLNTNKTFVIPHGSYIDVYPDSITRKNSREKLGIKSDEIMILFFGSVRQYKGVIDLIQAYSRLKSNKIRLVIAGNCIDKKLQKEILNFQKTIKFDFYNGYVSDEDVAKYFKASDIVCLPFKEITTSGSVLLALSFARPIVAPRIGDLINLPPDIGFLYDPTKTDSLFKTLSEAVSSKQLGSISKSAKIYTESLSWDKIAEKTHMVYENILRK